MSLSPSRRRAFERSLPPVFELALTSTLDKSVLALRRFPAAMAGAAARMARDSFILCVLVACFAVCKLWAHTIVEIWVWLVSRTPLIWWLGPAASRFQLIRQLYYSYVRRTVHSKNRGLTPSLQRKYLDRRCWGHKIWSLELAMAKTCLPTKLRDVMWGSFLHSSVRLWGSSVGFRVKLELNW